MFENQIRKDILTKKKKEKNDFQLRKSRNEGATREEVIISTKRKSETGDVNENNVTYDQLANKLIINHRCASLYNTEHQLIAISF